MRLAPTILAVCLLLLSGSRLGLRIREGWQQYREAKHLKSFVPSDGSHRGIGVKGNLKTPKTGGDTHILVFVLHRDGIMADIQFWNRVVERVAASGSRANDAPIEYWGICDDGRKCDSYQRLAQFSILGYLDPYQMHIVAKADAEHEAFLYGDRYMGLNARIWIAKDPTTEASLILQRAK